MAAAIDTERFLRDLDELRQIGRYRTGVHRPTYSPEDMESRRWLMERMQECGLEPAIDGIGNVLGRHRGTGPHLLVGSHIETQNYAGWLDGALGVVAGLALARAGLAVDVVAFADEEGHFEGGFLGSRSAIGALTEEEIDRSRSRNDGTPLREALATAGLAGLPRFALDAGRYRGFLEMHIEQGTQLEGAGERLGVVTGIVAIWQWRITIEGQQDHAGGTTMAERRDAGLAAVRLLAAIDGEFPRVCGERTTWTTGRIALEPGAPSIIPGRAEVLFQFRDVRGAGAGAAGKDAPRPGAGEQPARTLHGDARAVVARHAGPLRSRLDGGLGRGGRGRGARTVAPHALRRRARRAMGRPHHAGGHALRAVHRRHQPPLGGGHEAGGPGARLPGAGRGCGAHLVALGHSQIGAGASSLTVLVPTRRGARRQRATLRSNSPFRNGFCTMRSSPVPANAERSA